MEKLTQKNTIIFHIKRMIQWCLSSYPTIKYQKWLYNKTVFWCNKKTLNRSTYYKAILQETKCVLMYLNKFMHCCTYINASQQRSTTTYLYHYNTILQLNVIHYNCPRSYEYWSRSPLEWPRFRYSSWRSPSRGRAWSRCWMCPA